MSEEISERTGLLTGHIQRPQRGLFTSIWRRQAGDPGDDERQNGSPKSPPPVAHSQDPGEDDGEDLHNASSSAVQLILLNNGSVARDHLASERTFMAYVRTSLALSSAGIASMQLFRIGDNPEVGRLLGTLTISAGLLVLAIGTTRYFLVQKTLTAGFFPVATLGVGTIGVAIGGLVLAALFELSSKLL
ncbi:hypothetical protein FA15DRAFT_676445 [Coprinopsis marcescibilis]|uniref:DUF202 domain-containing protein n=1 Tax=Coprinopsis marcescibilis TaxID=230819 RepID=A0A5C3KB07_COPMA|nr:hypothetical protein FA15DRAFT_676445 [Coprinopsis marcescibilis]